MGTKAKSPLRVKMEQILEKDPEVSLDELVKLTKCDDRSKLSNYKSVIKTMKGLHLPAPAVKDPKDGDKQPFNPCDLHTTAGRVKMTLDLPKDGAEIRFTNGQVLFTLDIRKDSIVLLPANFKKMPEHRVPLNFLKLFQEHSFGIYESNKK